MSTSLASQELTDLFLRDLERFQDQVAGYPDESGLWVVEGSILNSGGTLAAHGAGNLLHFVGAVLGGTGYVRDRPREFGGEVVPREELIAGLEEAARVLGDVLPGLTDEQWAAPMEGLPDRFAGRSTLWFLIHLYGHLNWHLGQLDYHRRILGGG